MDLSSERYCKQFRYTNKFNGHRHVKPTPYILEGTMQFVVTHRSAPPKFHTTIPIRYSADYHHDYNSPTQCAYTTGDCTRLPPHTLTRVPRPLPHSVSRPTITPTALHRTEGRGGLVRTRCGQITPEQFLPCGAPARGQVGTAAGRVGTRTTYVW